MFVLSNNQNLQSMKAFQYKIILIKHVQTHGFHGLLQSSSFISLSLIQYNCNVKSSEDAETVDLQNVRRSLSLVSNSKKQCNTTWLLHINTCFVRIKINCFRYQKSCSIVHYCKIPYPTAENSPFFLFTTCFSVEWFIS